MKYPVTDKKGRKLYTGHFSEGEKNGIGKIEYRNGMTYEGQFEEGRPHGYGITHYSDFSIYKGYFEHGLYNGKGTLKTVNCIFDGDWGKGKIMKGLLYFSESDKRHLFDGTFIDGSMSYGKLIFKDGREYQGEFRDNIPHGKGVAKLFPKIVCEGTWENGIFISFA